MPSVLITGGTGYFGKHFAREVLDRSLYDRVCIYSRDEWKQAQMRQAFENDPRLRWFIGDVRDLPRLSRAMRGCDLVIHAAALKRIETGVYNACEMIKTNIGGAMNVIDAATSSCVDRVVALSTDKAFEPVSPYGQTKALAESLFLNSNTSRGASGPRFSVVRYGNVAGSTGSVIPIWREILKTGNAVPVTDPNCTRFWMWAREAVELVLQAVEMMPEEVLIPELPAYRLGDLAEAMGAKMEVRGLGSFEKPHESMRAGMSSNHARRMGIAELRGCLATL